MMRARLLLFVSLSAALVACTKADRGGDVPILARPAPEPVPMFERPAPCEHLPTDLARAKVPLSYAVTWSADGASIAAAIADSGNAGNRVEGAEGIVVWSVADGSVRKRYRVDAQAVAFAHAGDRLAFASVTETGVIDLRTDCAQRWPTRGPLVAWSTDDRALYVAGWSVLSELDPARGTVVRERGHAQEYPRIVGMDVAANGIVVVDDAHYVQLVAPGLSRSVPLPSTPNGIGNARAVAIAANGATAAYAAIEEVPLRQPPNVMPGPPSTPHFFVRVVTLPDRQVHDVFPGDPEALAFSPDGALLAIAGNLDRKLIVRDVKARESRVLDGSISYPRRIAWSPDGRALALADWRDGIRVYDARGVGPTRVLTP